LGLFTAVRRTHVLVCHCHRVCDRTILECIRNGARSIEEVSRSCGAGTSCGGCRPAIDSIVGRAILEPRPSARLEAEPARGARSRSLAVAAH
jgi:NAD(P)H-nitrite reductase large subunit